MTTLIKCPGGEICKFMLHQDLEYLNGSDRNELIDILSRHCLIEVKNHGKRIHTTHRIPDQREYTKFAWVLHMAGYTKQGIWFILSV